MLQKQFNVPHIEHLLSRIILVFMLISPYTIAFSSIALIALSTVIHHLISLSGIIYMYLLSLIEVLLRNTVDYMPMIISHLQSVWFYIAVLINIMMIIIAAWINIKYYEIKTMILGPIYLFTNTIGTSINNSILCLRWMVKSRKRIET